MAASSRLLLRSHEAVSLQENASVLLQGSIHQRDGIFSPDSRGRQCLPCCLVLLVKAVLKRICTNNLNVNNMNEILFAGDKLYKYAKKNAKTYHDYLEPCDLPSYFSLDNQHYPWKVKKKKTKQKKKTKKKNIFLDLETGLAMTFSFNPYAVFICNGFSIALLEQGDCFYLFESHARASDGMPNVNGKNIFVKENKYNWHFPYICVDCLVLIIPLLQQR